MVQTGTYFRSGTMEIRTITEEDPTLLDDGWRRVSDDTTLRLTEIRALLIERGLVDERMAKDVYWSMPGPEGSDSSPDVRLSAA